MSVFAALDVSQEETAICVVDRDGGLLAEAKVPTRPDAIARWLAERAEDLERVGMETGPLAIWLWNALTAREVPLVCLDARHASGVLKMMPNKTDRHDAAASPRSCAPAGLRPCRSRATMPMSIGRCLRRATPWWECGSGWKMRSGACLEDIWRDVRPSALVGSNDGPRKSSEASWRSLRNSFRSSKL